MGLMLTVNGQSCEMADLSSPAPLVAVIEHMELKADRVAVELNGVIAPRTVWPDTAVKSGDRLEIVHFVGGGCQGSA